MGFYQQILGKSIGAKIADIVLGFIDGLTPEQVGKFIANIINNAFGLVAGFVEQMNKKDGWRKLGNWLRDSLEEAVRNIDSDTVAEAIGGFISGALDLAITFFSNQEDWASIGYKIGEILGKIPWIEIWAKVITFINNAWITASTLFWSFLAGIAFEIVQWMDKKLAELKTKMTEIITKLIEVIPIEGVKIQTKLAELWEKIKEWWSQNISSKLTLKYWEEKLEPIKKAFKNVFKGAVNAVIEQLNNMITVVEKALNTIVSKINAINIVNPFTGSEIWSPHLPKFEFARIPKLAKGGIVAQPTHAIIGEQGREAVMPLENNTEWMDMLAEKLNTRGGNITIRFTGSTAQLVRLLKPELEKEDKRTGKRLIVGGAY